LTLAAERLKIIGFANAKAVLFGELARRFQRGKASASNEFGRLGVD
jgi:hypothetical protein